MTRFFYLDASRRPIGPFSADELRRLQGAGLIGPDSEIIGEARDLTVRLRDLLPAEEGRDGEVPPRLPASDGAAPPPLPPAAKPSLARQTSDDLELLSPHLLLPLKEVRTFRWTENRRVLALAVIGLFPLAVIELFARHDELRKAYWSVAFYFSVLWGMFFYMVFPAPGVRLRECAVAFFLTGLLSIGVLQVAYRIPPLIWLVKWIDSPDTFVRLAANVGGVGLAEELCKAAVVWLLLRREPGMRPQTSLFYGLIAGLGFGIYEGVNYQLNINQRLAGGSPAIYYLLNLVRVTTLPFLHAMWAGIAGYFLGFAALYPRRRVGLTLVAIGLPSVLHGLHNTFSNSVMVLAVALLTVLALNLYLARSVMLQEALEFRPSATTNPKVPGPLSR